MREQREKSQEDNVDNGFRFVYNVNPGNKESLDKVVLPLAFHYTPLSSDTHAQMYVKQNWLKCRKCGSYINKHCTIKREKQLWICCICMENNQMPSGEIPQNLLQSEVYEVLLQENPNKHCKNYIFLIDLCITNKELSKVKSMIIELIKFKTHQKTQGFEIQTKITLITFSKYVYVYQWNSPLDSVVCIGSQKEYATSEIINMLRDESPLEKKYCVRVKNNSEQICKRIMKLKAEGEVNEGLKNQRSRVKRGYGQALNVALSFCQCMNEQFRIINTLGGPCTFGVGKVLDTDFKKQMRSKSDLDLGENLQNYETAVNFYNRLKNKIKGSFNIILDLFIFCVEETGLTEMNQFVSMSGGLLVLGEEFDNAQALFQKSFRKAYLQNEESQMWQTLGTYAFCEIICSRDIALNGMLGNCHSMIGVGDKKIAQAGTNKWYLGGIDCYKTLTVQYELRNSQASDNCLYFQVQTCYKNYWGMQITRTATAKKLVDINICQIAHSFDQQAAIAFIARLYTHKISGEVQRNFRLWLDQLLVKWTSTFASYTKGDPHSFYLPEQMKFFPQYVYYFRRTNFVKRTGISLDQLTYQTYILNRETVGNILTIIEPALLSYSVENPSAVAVRLEEEEMKGEVVLLLDTYFNVLLWQGEHVAYWQEQDYHKKEEYQHVKHLLQAPEQDIKFVINNRFPQPCLFRTNPCHPTQRYLKSKISPRADKVQNERTLTDDSSITQFTKALIQMVVNKTKS